ncbi:MAG TPA: DUF5668 domain-containing protein [bacterium]
MAKNKNQMVWGVFFILLGGILLAGNFTTLHLDELWPVFLIAGGAAFCMGYFLNRNNYGLLMPGTVLLVIGILFLYCSIEGWYHMEDLWPVFILAPALGFVAMYFGGEKEKGLLVPAGILFAIGLLFLFISTGLEDLWPVLLILTGVLLLIRDFTKRKSVQGKAKRM